MPHKTYKLPEYPIKSDVWDNLAREERPIVVYGMGNGADKLFERLDKYGVKISDVFASDGFVRGHSFRGFKVLSFSEIKEKYAEFVILLSFASNRIEVIEMIKNINREYELYVPDMPVASAQYFDREFYNSNYTSILDAYNALADDESRNVFSAMVNYKLTGRLDYLLECYCSTDEIYALMPKSISVAIDAGAYNGDTVRELIAYRNSVNKIYAIEPDARNYKKLLRFVTENEQLCEILPINAAVWDSDCEGSFKGSGNRNSSVSSTASYENRKEAIPLVKLDSITRERIDYIKYDVEGAETEALYGSADIISGYRPSLLVSAYHKSEDIYSLVNLIAEKYPFYDLYMRKTLCFPAWEIAIIAIEKNLPSGNNERT